MDPATEESAKKADEQAMDVDFLSLDLKKAKKKLQDALKKCGKGKCSAATMAALHRDLGVVLFNSKDAKGGTKEIDAAFNADASVTIAKDYLDNPDVKKAWEASAKKHGVGGGTPPPPVSTGKPSGSGDGDESIPNAEGNLAVAVKKAPVGSELPLLIEVPKGTDIAKVKVSYKTEAMEKYKVVEAKKVKSKWLAILDCSATNAAGTLKYFIKAYDGDDVELEHYGTIKKPAIVKLSDSVADEDKPLLPGDEEPKSCSGEEGSSGGGEEGGSKPEGSGCEADEECEKGLVCIEKGDSGKKKCQPGESKKEPAGAYNKLWFGLDGQLDVLFLGADRDLCKQKSWACDVNGQDVGVPDTQGIAVKPGDRTGGKTDGGTSIGTKRVFLSFDYFLARSFSVGARLGYIFGGNDTSVAKFVPFHAEVRGQFFFTDSGLRPYALLGAGYGRTEAGVPDVIITPNDPTKATGTVNGEPVVTGVKAWKLGGPLFVTVGAGAWVMLGQKAAINLAFKLLFPLPTLTFGVAPELGFKIGF